MTYSYRTPSWILAIIISHLTSPLARLWFALTHDDLTIEMGTFAYHVTSSIVRSSGGGRFGAFALPTAPGARPRYLNFDVVGGRVRIYETKRVRIFPKCPGSDADYSAIHSPIRASHSAGPVEITISRCDPSLPAPPPPRRHQLPELLEHVRIPVFGPPSSPFGMVCVGSGGLDSGSRAWHHVSLLFAHHPASNEDPYRTEEYLEQVRSDLRKREDLWTEEQIAQFNKELKRRRIDSSFEKLFQRPRDSTLARRIPVPIRSLELDSRIHMAPAGVSEPVPGAPTDWGVQHLFDRDPYGPQLYDALSAEVHEQFSEYECKVLCRQANPTVHRCAPDLISEIAASGARAVRRRFAIEGMEFQGLMLYWPYSRPLCAFQLSQADVPASTRASRLTGTSYGIALEDLEQLLEQLVDITKRLDLAAVYQKEQDEYLEWVHTAYRTT